MKNIRLYSILLLLFAVSLGTTACEPGSGDRNDSSTASADSAKAADSLAALALQADEPEETPDSTLATAEAPTPTETDSEAEPKATESPKGANADKPDDKATSTGRLDKCYLKASFISMASGPDNKSIEKLKAEINAFQKAEKVELIYEIKPWGREGERDYCFSSLGLTDSQREKWAIKVRKTFKGNDMVLVPD